MVKELQKTQLPHECTRTKSLLTFCLLFSFSCSFRFSPLRILFPIPILILRNMFVYLFSLLRCHFLIICPTKAESAKNLLQN